MKERPEFFRPEQKLNPDLCDAGAVLYQLSYQANWELVIMWVYLVFMLLRQLLKYPNITLKIIKKNRPIINAKSSSEQ